MNVEVNRCAYIALANTKFVGYSFYDSDRSYFKGSNLDEYITESMFKSGIGLYVNVKLGSNQGVCKHVHSIRL